MRAVPVRRDEVLCRGAHILTMPVGTYQKVEVDRREGSHIRWAYIGIPELWQPLCDELYAKALEGHAHWEKMGLSTGSPEPIKSVGDIRYEWARWGYEEPEERCAVCGVEFFPIDYSRRRRDKAVCSNRCEQTRQKHQQQRHVEHQREWRRKQVGRDFNPGRTKRRDAAREGKICAHCGQPIVAERSTKKFCSDRCKVAAHRARLGENYSPSRMLRY